MIAWFAGNHVAANLLAAIVVITGLVAMGPRLLLPDAFWEQRFGLLVIGFISIAALFLHALVKDSLKFANFSLAVVLIGGVVVADSRGLLPERIGDVVDQDSSLVAGNLRREIFPEFSSDMITIVVPYRGAAPEEVEEGVCVRVEEAIEGLEGVKEIVSYAREGSGTVRVEVMPGADSDKVLAELKNKVDAIDTFPEETDKPVIEEIVIRKQVINVAVSGDADERTLKRLGEQVRDELSAIPGITQTALNNARPYEIAIEVSEGALRRYGLTFDEVANAVRRSSVDLPGGAIRASGGEILLRTKGQAYRREEFERIVLRAGADGTRVELGDVAEVDDGFAETDQFAKFDGKPSVLVQAFRTGGQSALEISRKVKKYVAENRHRMPEGVEMTTWMDDSIYLRDRLSTLTRNGRAGLLLVFLVLALFLRFRLAFWVTLGIPISFLGTFMLMPFLDVSVNLMSLFAFIVVLGIVVDDAIVVGENIHAHQHGGRPGLKGAISGAQEMMVPVFFAVMTSVAAFFSLANIEGNTGRVLAVIPLVVMPTLLFSLAESLLILPAHLSGLDPVQKEHPGGLEGAWARVQGVFSGGLKRFIERVYHPVLHASLRQRYLTVAAGIAALALTLGLVRGGWIRFHFLPDVEGDFVAAMLIMPLGTPPHETEKAVRRIEEAAFRVRDRIEGDGREKVYQHFLASIGAQPYRQEQNTHPGTVGASFSGGHLGEVLIEVTPSHQRSIRSSDIANMWREETGPIPGAEELVFSSTIFSAGNSFNIQLAGRDMDRLRAAADALKAKLGSYPDVIDVADSFRAGKEEVKLNIKPEAEALGLSLADLAKQVRQAFYGEEAQRIQRGRDDIRVMVRYPAENRRSLGDLEQMRIRTPDGREVAFSEVAEAEYGRGFSTITRVGRQRTINVTADLKAGSEQEPDKILASLEEEFLDDLGRNFPGISFAYAGEKKQQKETTTGIIRGFFVALVIIYALLAAPFKSYIQPMIVMTAIPFGFVGAIWGHVIMGADVTVLSMFGLVALTGVVVNDSLVMVDYVNRRRREGMGLIEAVHTSGVNRFRAILLTSLTTFAGLTPLLLEKSVEAQFLIPMAISLGFGVLFATFITLLLVPATYLILEDIRHVCERWLGIRFATTMVPAPDEEAAIDET